MITIIIIIILTIILTKIQVNHIPYWSSFFTGISPRVQICEYMKQGATIHRIDDQQVPYLVKRDQWVGYDDVESIKNKVRSIVV